jgi:nucleoside-diphosphate-sugar epimerase
MRRWTLVTGGAGYVGSLLVPMLLSQGRNVRVLDSLKHGNGSSLLGVWGDDRFEFVHGDVDDETTLVEASRDLSEIVHLAAIVGDPACSREPDEARRVNVDATRRLLDLAQELGVDRFLFSSTCSNYGKMEAGDALATEEWELRPVSLYAETKVEAELETLARANPDFTTACLRLATVYGVSPRMRFDLTVNEFVRDVAVQGSLVVYGEQFWRPYVHVRDAARAFVAALDAPQETLNGEVFNVGSTSENYRKLDLVELLRERVPSADVQFVHRDEDPRDYRVSFEKIGTVLGYGTTRSVPDGIDEVLRLLESSAIEDPYAVAYRA